LHLQACQRPKAAHRNLLFAGPQGEAVYHISALSRLGEGAEPALQCQGFGGEGAGRAKRSSVRASECESVGGGQRLLLAPDAVRFADLGVGVLCGHGEELVARLFDGVLHSHPVEQCALGLLLSGRDLDQEPDTRKTCSLIHFRC
jgi:hypothetical protein